MKYFILIIICSLPLLTLAQLKNVQHPEPVFLSSDNNLSLSSQETSWQEEVRHIKYCLGKYRTEKLYGIWLTVGGGIVAGVSTGLYQNGTINDNAASAGYIAGGLSVITGYVLQITCNRWLRKAAIGPADSGIGIKMSF